MDRTDVSDDFQPSGRWVLPLDGSQDLSRELVGGKAWSLNRMRALGIPTPPAAVMTVETCRAYQSRGSLPPGAWDQLLHEIEAIGGATGRRFGGAARPLILSVRSGAARSMPGMMDTILNVGMTEAVERSLAEETGNAAFAADTRERFEHEFRRIVLGSATSVVPADPFEQLRLAVLAVLASWNSARARTYREHHGLPHDGGTAVTVQAMVFGNLDHRSGTGVLFSRDPISGERRPFGEWLRRAQGEDVVSGRHTPEPLEQMLVDLPDAHRELLAIAQRLEIDGRDIQDIEFTVESGRLWVLQSRPAKRSARAAVRLAISLSDEGVICVDEALRRVTPEQLRSLLQPQLDTTALSGTTLLARGIPACAGFGSGLVVTDATAAAERGEAEDVILACKTTSPEDIHGMLAARAVITAIGGATSHAAVVSRELGIPCVVGCGEAALATMADRSVTVDGMAGCVYDGRIDVMDKSAADDTDFKRLTDWLRARVPPHTVVNIEALPSLLAAVQAMQ
jgi:pyruvate,orthophosphate dikinase